MKKASKAPQEDPLTRKLKIQIGVYKRLVKEVLSYQKEVITNEARVQKMRDDGKDEYDIRKQEEVLQESYMMIPESKNRLDKATEELVEIIEKYEEECESINKAILDEAKDLIAQAQSSTA